TMQTKQDGVTQALVATYTDPLTTFVDRSRPLYHQRGVSTVLVMGGSGDYMDVADQVIMMDSYRARDVTETARALAANPTGRQAEAQEFPPVSNRVVDPGSLPLGRV